MHNDEKGVDGRRWHQHNTDGRNCDFSFRFSGHQTDVTNLILVIGPIISKPANLPNNDKIYVDYNDEDLDCLSRSIYFEAGNQSSIGKLAVGLVVMNRVTSERYPDTICGVVNQQSQFSWVDDGKSDTPKEDWAWDDSKRIAKDILGGKAEFIDFDGVMHYHADYVSPRWSKRLTQVAQIDQHVFYE